jgi:hypothetical protein
MELISLVGAVALAVAAFGYVIAPLWRRPGRAAGQPTEDPKLLDLVHERDVTVRTLHDLDFDYRLGKLSEEDYQALRARYTAQGVTILQELDAALGVGSADLEKEIETEVQRRRGVLETTADGRPPTAVHPSAAVGGPWSAVVLADTGLADEIEAEIRRRRAARPAPAAAPERRKQPARTRARRTAAGPAGQCARCGATLARTCPTCGTVVASDARFCAQCGAKLPEYSL